MKLAKCEALICLRVSPPPRAKPPGGEPNAGHGVPQEDVKGIHTAAQ